MTICQTDARRNAVRAKPELNGLDYVEVSNDQRTLMAYFLGRAPADVGLTRQHFRIEGGRRVLGRDIAIDRIEIIRAADPEVDDAVLLHLSRFGDHATYTLRLVDVPNIDPRYDHVEFSFKVDCGSAIDCALPAAAGDGCPPVVAPAPHINYLAKDYASFRQLILDRLALVMPEWRERHIPDLGIALVEVLAYVGDHLSYFQDAVATEAYLDTARQRISVRRHARLVDYCLHEGCNARAWVYVEVNQDVVLDPAQFYFITRVTDTQPPAPTPDLIGVQSRGPVAYEVFEVVGQDKVPLYTALNEILFYTWGQRECCLPCGATSATLRGHLPLRANDVLILEAVIGPRTGNPADADPTHRHAVRLTQVTQGQDPLDGTAITEVSWAQEDALPFALCISLIGPAPDCVYIENASVARGNVLLVDHGKTEARPPMPEMVPTEASAQICTCEGKPSDVQVLAGHYSPKLPQSPITHSQPVPTTTPAAHALLQDPRKALPQVVLHSGEHVWQPRLDLLGSGPNDAHFVIETDNDGAAHVRFGDGVLGQAPAAGATFTATYRVGNGVAGNVGAEAIAHLINRTADVPMSAIARVRNPLPARGGTEPEPMAEAKLFAPFAFRRGPNALQRAITPEDYARLAERIGALKVQRAAAALRWTGSWYEADVAIDAAAVAAAAAGDDLHAQIYRGLHRYRRIGHDVHVLHAQHVPIELKLEICVLPHALRGHVRAALLDVFSNRVLPNGQRGFFHPDNLSFGQSIYLSKVVAAAAAVPGVANVNVSMLQRQFEAANGEIENGVLPIGPYELAQLDNDPSFPEHGVLRLNLSGGR